jgi:CBS domain-containing protein
MTESPALLVAAARSTFMKTVKQLLEANTAGVVTIAPDASVFDALALMAVKDIGAVVVMREHRVVGIMSERDYARKVILHHRASKEITVAQIMTEKVLYVRPTQTIEDCMALMTDKHIRHLPVLDGDRLIGVLSIGDLVKATISEQDFVIRQLERYIMS